MGYGSVQLPECRGKSLSHSGDIDLAAFDGRASKHACAQSEGYGFAEDDNETTRA